MTEALPQRSQNKVLCRISGLNVSYETSDEPVHALRDIHFQMHSGEIVAVVGESGSGKTTLARALLAGLPANARVEYKQFDVPQRIAFVQQEAVVSLHPLFSIGKQISDIVAAFEKDQGTKPKRQHVRAATYQLLEQLHLQPAEQFYNRFPHQLSGGQAQRASLARALALQAHLLIADEPTSHLDLVTQAEAVKLLYRVAKQHGMGTLFITHRLPLVAEIADTVIVLHEGRIVECGKVIDVWQNPQHTYTKSLLFQMRQLQKESETTPRRPALSMKYSSHSNEAIKIDERTT